MTLTADGDIGFSAYYFNGGGDQARKLEVYCEQLPTGRITPNFYSQHHTMNGELVPSELSDDSENQNGIPQNKVARIHT